MKAKKVKSVIGRIGGKARLASWIASHLKKHDWSFYCEPFVGSAAVYFQLYNEGVFRAIGSGGTYIPRMVLNDADSKIVNLFKVCRDRPDDLARAVELTPYSRLEHEMARENESIEELERARQFLVLNQQSFSCRDDGGWSYSLQSQVSQSRKNIAVWNRLPEKISQVAVALKECYLENDDAIAVIHRWATLDTCFYCDPPYVGTEYYYPHNRGGAEKQWDMHEKLAATLNDIPAACVAVSYYPHEILDAWYPKNKWEWHYKTACVSSGYQKGVSKPSKTELLLVRKQSDRTKLNYKQLSLF